MADLAVAFGTSHSPALFCRAEDYPRYAEPDRYGRRLLDKAGRPCSYDELLQQAGPAAADRIAPDAIAERVARCEAGLDHLSRAIDDAALDALIIVGDDQGEQFHDDNMPAILVYWGETIAGLAAGPGGTAQRRDFPVASGLGRHLIERLVVNEFDVSQARELRFRHGEGHAFAFVRMRLMGGADLPVVPVALNTYFAPNQPRPARCYALGRAIRAAVEDWDGGGRVGILASGGLSHYAIDEELDRLVLKACRDRDAQTLARLPLNQLNSGNSEIRNWITVAGAAEHLAMNWHEYVPCYRTPAGTGCGMAFAVWS